jgi:hypothetical protein
MPINFALTSLCQQRSKQLLFNTPLPRYTPISPYNGEFTKFQLDMRRKAEVLKHNNNASSTKTNNLTKAEKWSQIVKGNSNSQSSNFPSINLTLIDYEGNYSNITVKYPDTIETKPTPQYYIDTNGNTVLDINAYQIVGNNGYYYVNVITGGALNQCNKNALIPTPTSSSDVPGSVIYLIDDETVPLYNYNKNVNVNGYDSNREQTKLWFYNPKSDIFLLNGKNTNILTMMVSNLVNQPSNIFTLKFPISLYVTGTNISSNVLLHPTNNLYNFTGLNVGIQSIKFSVKYNDNPVQFTNPPIITISGSPLTYNNGTYTVNNTKMDFDILFQKPPTSSTDYYTAKLYIGYITISNIDLPTKPGYVYDFYLTVNSSNINFQSNNINDQINYNNNIQNTVIGCYVNSSTQIIQHNTNITQGTYGSPETPPLKENNFMLT